MERLNKSLLAFVCLTMLTTAACSKKKSAKPRSAPPATAGAATAETATDTSVPTEDDPNGLDGNEEGGNQPPVTRERDDGYEITDRTPRHDDVIEFPTDDGGNGGARNQECGTSYRRNTQQWFPGLPYPPSQTPICTGGSFGDVGVDGQLSCDPEDGYLFTDSRQDGLMAMLVERFNALPEEIQHESRQLSGKIRDLRVHADLYGSGRVKVQFAVATGRDEYKTFTIRGRLENWRGKRRIDVRLRKTEANGMKFSGMLTCADLNNGCQNSVVRLHQLGRRDRVKAAIYVVHRWGDAHLTISDKDLKHHRSIENNNHQKFAQLLSNSAINSCLSALAAVQSGERQMPTCAQRRLFEMCGGKEYREPSAKVLDFRSWAVVYGYSGFEFAAYSRSHQGLYDFEDDAQKAVLAIRGPLLISGKQPMWNQPLIHEGRQADGIKRVILATNDGGGNVNLQVDFKGQPNSFTRVSLTTLLSDTGFDSGDLVDNAEQMPGIEMDEDTEQEPDDVVEFPDDGFNGGADDRG